MKKIWYCKQCERVYRKKEKRTPCPECGLSILYQVPLVNTRIEEKIVEYEMDNNEFVLEEWLDLDWDLKKGERRGEKHNFL